MNGNYLIVNDENQMWNAHFLFFFLRQDVKDM